MKKIALCHRLAAMMSCALLLAFWLSTILSEIFGSLACIIAVKYLISYAIFLLIICFMMTAITGMKLSQKSNNPIIKKKKIRMPFIALNGLFILMPSAFFLKNAALHQQFNTVFWFVQSIELIFGAINIILVFQNISFGIKLKKQRS